MSRVRMIATVAALVAAGIVTSASGASPASSAGVSPSIATGHVQTFRTYLAQAHGDVAAALRARQRDLFVRGVDGPLVGGGSTGAVAVVFSSAGPTGAEPVGSLDGRGDDLLDVRYPRVGNKSSLQLLVRQASSGGVLWSRSFALSDNSFAIPFPLATGPRHTPGIVVMTIADSNANGRSTQTLTLTALSGTGRTLWTHRESGSIDNSGSAKNLPELLGTLGRRGAESDSLVIGRVDWSFSNNGGASGGLTALRLDGDGKLTALGAKLSSNTGVPDLTPVGDLNGDGYRDVVTTNPGGDVIARDGRAGAQLWANSDETLNDGAQAQPVGDVVASAAGAPSAGDIAVATGTPPPGVLSGLPLPVADPTSPAHGHVALLDGASGTTQWSETGDMPYAVERAGSGLQPAVGVLTADTTSTTSGNGSTTETLTLTTYDDTGAQLYTHAYSTTVSGDGSNNSFGVAIAVPVGDFEPDGAVDGLAVLIAGNGSHTKQYQTYFHGVDGSTFPASSMDPLGASTTGRGDGWVTVTTHKGVTVTVSRGIDRRRLFARKLPNTSSLALAYAYGVNVNRDRCADVLVSGMGKKTGYLADLASNGKVRWYVGFSSTSKAAGVLHRYTVTAPCR